MANPILDELMHYGMPRRSGRYPWGSGENPYQHEDWYDAADQNIRKKEMTSCRTVPSNESSL